MKAYACLITLIGTQCRHGTHLPAKVHVKRGGSAEQCFWPQGF